MRRFLLAVAIASASALNTAPALSAFKTHVPALHAAPALSFRSGSPAPRLALPRLSATSSEIDVAGQIGAAAPEDEDHIHCSLDADIMRCTTGVVVPTTSDADLASKAGQRRRAALLLAVPLAIALGFVVSPAARAATAAVGAQMAYELAHCTQSPAKFFGFCGACCNWFLGLSAIYDASRVGPEVISLPMTFVMLAYSVIFARWAGWDVMPRNFILAGSHFLNIGAQVHVLLALPLRLVALPYLLTTLPTSVRRQTSCAAACATSSRASRTRAPRSLLLAPRPRPRWQRFAPSSSAHPR